MKKITIDQMSVMSVHYTRYSLEYALDSIASAGLKNFEFYGGSPHYCAWNYCKEDAAKRVKYIRKAVEQRGLNIVCFTPEQCIYPINIAAREKELRDRSVEHYMNYLEDTVNLGSKAMFITSGWGYLDEPIAEAWKRSKDSLEKLASKAESLGIVLYLEQLAPDESTIVYNLPTIKKMLKEINSSNLKCCIDTIAMEIQKETLADYFREIPEFIAHLHFNDGCPAGHLVWGEGEANAKQYLDTLRENNYSGCLTMEINNEIYLKDPDSATKRSLEYLKQYLD